MAAEGPAQILLLGAGHANLLALARLRAALPRTPILLIDAAACATYSGMVPGCVAGHYAPQQAQVDLARLAQRHGVAFRQAQIVGLDPVRRLVHLGCGTALPWGVAALDIGSHARMPEISGFARHGLPVKPLDGVAARLRGMAGDAPAVIIGAGVAGAEMALALRHGRSGPVTLIEAAPAALAGLGARAQAVLRRALADAGVGVLTGMRVVRVQAGAVILSDGRRIASALTLGMAGARAAPWLARDLPTDAAGFVRVTPTLAVEGQDRLFAAGDCAAMTHAPRPKAGVFAVRQAPVLARNLVAAHLGQVLARHDPQAAYLRIIALGGRDAVAEWRGLTLRGGWVWRCKDLIDRRFVAGLRG